MTSLSSVIEYNIVSKEQEREILNPCLVSAVGCLCYRGTSPGS